jgi:hypothetical protein
MSRLTLVPEGGLCNRVYAITSAIHFAKKHNIRLTIVWIKYWGMGAGFHELFNLSPLVEHVDIREASFETFLNFKYVKPLKANFFLSLYLKLKFDTFYFWYKKFNAFYFWYKGPQFSVDEWYLSHLNAHILYLFHCQKFYDNSGFLNFLLPVDSIQKKIDEQVKLISPQTIGIHVRRKDLLESITQSPLPAFIKKMQQEIDIDPETNFYVASDSPEEKKNLTEIFGDRIITVENDLSRNTKDGIVDALIELYTLASTRKIYGSFKSTYSTLASEIKGIPIEIVTEDNKITNEI